MNQNNQSTDSSVTNILWLFKLLTGANRFPNKFQSFLTDGAFVVPSIKISSARALSYSALLVVPKTRAHSESRAPPTRFLIKTSKYCLKKKNKENCFINEIYFIQIELYLAWNVFFDCLRISDRRLYPSGWSKYDDLVSVISSRSSIDSNTLRLFSSWNLLEHSVRTTLPS